MKLRAVLVFLLVLLAGSFMFASPGLAKKKPSLDKWKPDFDPKGAKYRCIVSNVSTPGLVGVLAGFGAIVRKEFFSKYTHEV